MIIVKPKGGLGNRLRVIHSVLSIQSMTGVQVQILWDRDRHCNCKFEDLFEPDTSITYSNSKPYLVNKILKKFDNEIFRFFNVSSKNIKKLDDNKIKQLRKSGFDFLNLADQEKVYIETCEWFYTSPERMFLYPIPNISIKKEVKNITTSFTDTTMGFHIRMGDHRTARLKSPIRLFIRQIDNLLENNNEVKIYLSTDSEEVENQILADYSDSIITQQNKQLKRDTRAGAKSSFVDMLCLAKTTMIYGSAHSTFSGIAAAMGGIKKIVLSE